MPKTNYDCYPKEIRIGDDTYEIRFVSRIAESRRIVGLCDPSTYIIRIKRGQTPPETLKTFIHEILHAIEFSHELSIPHQLIYKLEDCIYRFLSDNFHALFIDER